MVTMATLEADRQCAREALAQQLALLVRDAVFPDANLSQDERDLIAQGLGQRIRRHDARYKKYLNV
jgi:hypothetical protein